MNPPREGFRFDGCSLIANGAASLSLPVEEFHEIGFEPAAGTPDVGDVFLVINRATHNIRIPEGAAIFRGLLDFFVSFKGFNWRSVVDAKGSPDHRYFLCWQKASHLSRPSNGCTETSDSPSRSASLLEALLPFLWVNTLIPILGGCA